MRQIARAFGISFTSDIVNNYPNSKGAHGLADLAYDLKIEIRRNAEVALHRFTDYFIGFEQVDAVKRIFGDQTKKVLDTLKIELAGTRGYMGVSDEDGHLIVGVHYLKDGNLADIYLDVIHELVHVKQFMEGKELFDSDYRYVDRPTEVEAYRYAVAEARRLGFNDERISQYLRTEWMSIADLRKLAKSVGVKCVWGRRKSERENQ
jgi:hypothetical protein